MSDEPIVDAELVPEDDGVDIVSPVEASTQLVRRERRSEVIKPLDAGELVESFKAYQALLPRLLHESDYQSDGKDKFVKKSGWRKIATAFDLDVQLVRSNVERDENGEPVRAEVWARAIAPSGRLMDGDGYCSVGEKRFANPKGRQKLENDLRATATTRAMNRAISGLVGMGAVSAEEVDTGAREQTGPPYGPAALDEQVAQARRAISFLLDLNNPDDARVNDVLQWVARDAGGYLPASVTRGIGHTAKQAKAVRDALRDEEGDEGERVAEAERIAAEDDPLAEEFTKPLEERPDASDGLDDERERRGR